MEKRRKSSTRKRKRRRVRWGRVFVLLAVLLIIILAIAGGISLLVSGGIRQMAGGILPGFGESPCHVLETYVECLNGGDYEGVYRLLSESAKEEITAEQLTERYQSTYGKISAADFTIRFAEEAETKEENGTVVSYTLSMNTCAGVIDFDNRTMTVEEKGSAKICWTDGILFPDLEAEDSIRLTSSVPKRGCIFDRDGNLLAGNGTASSVGVVPGKLKEDSLERLAQVLDSTVESIEKKMSAAWVKEDSFVPIRTIEKLTDAELSTPQENTAEKKDLQDALLDIPGVMLQDTEVRIYPLQGAASHLIGYIQNISAEELEADTEGVYNSSSQIGKSGLEKAYEERLRGTNGHRITMVGASGDVKQVLAITNAVAGEDITLTIDSALQKKIYETYEEYDSGTVAMNPKTGEILAMVNTPSFDSNAFSLGIREAQWNAWNEDPRKPLTNRYRSLWTPGSSMKAITGAIGVSTGLLDPDRDYGSSSSWQASASWGSYRVTTLHVSGPANLLNSMIVSDNVYYAKAAVTIGQEAMEEGWKSLGFGENIPLAGGVPASSFSSEEHLSSEIMLADSGYGQGQMQVSPVHMAVMYTAFCNGGSMILPHLELQEETSFWKEQVITEEAAERIHSALRQVVNSSYGTAHSALMGDLPIAGKTGTAELKQSRDEEGGREIGWFTSYTTEMPDEEALMICTMVEGVEDIGGSGFVVRQSRDLYRFYYELDEE